METEINPEQLMKDLLYAQQLKDARILILFLHLYTEHFINLLCREKRITCRTYREKLQKLSEMNVILKEVVGIVELVYDLRIELVHNLRPESKLLERWIREHKPPIIYESAISPSSIAEFNSAIENANPISKIQLLAIPAIVYLYKTLKMVRNEEIDYDMQIHLTNAYAFTFEFLRKVK